MKYLKIHGYKLIILLCCCLLLTSCSYKLNFKKVELTIPKESIENSNYFIDTTYLNDGGYINVYIPNNVLCGLYYKDDNGLFNYNNANYNLVSLFPLLENAGMLKITMINGPGEYMLVGVIIHDNELNKDTYVEKEELFNYNLNVVNDVDFTISNTMTNFDSMSICKEIAELLYDENDEACVNNIVKYVYENISYSTKRYKPYNYIANIDATLYYKNGVCTDYATLTAALLKLCKIPTKLIYGTYNNTIHAWCEVYYNNNWHLVDATANNIDNELQSYQVLYKF